jgi:hypothetical protein
MPIIQATWEVEIRRIVISETPSQQKNAVLTHACHPN